MLGVTEIDKTDQGTLLRVLVTAVTVIKACRRCLCQWRIILYRLKEYRNLVKHTVYPSMFPSCLLIHVGLIFFFPLKYLQYCFTACLSSLLGVRNSLFFVMMDNMMFEFHKLPCSTVNSKIMEVSDSTWIWWFRSFNFCRILSSFKYFTIICCFHLSSFLKALFNGVCQGFYGISSLPRSIKITH